MFEQVINDIMYNCAAEMALLVEGLGVGGETQLEEWLLRPEKMENDDEEGSVIEEGQIKLFGPDDTTWVATQITDESGSLARLSRTANMDNRTSQYIDPVVTMLGSLQSSNNFPLFSHDVPFEDERADQWDEEAQTPRHADDGYHSDTGLGDDNLEAPLLHGNKRDSGFSLPFMSRNNSKSGQGYGRSGSHSRNRPHVPLSRQSSQNRRYSRSNSKEMSGHYSKSYSKSMAQDGGVPESFGSVGIGGGWQLAWRWEEGGKDGEEGGLKRVFLKGDGGELSQFQSALSLPGIEPQPSGAESFQVC